METFKEDRIICPYCDYIDENSHEVLANKDILKCFQCGKLFQYERHIEISYSTKRDCNVNNEPHHWTIQREDGERNFVYSCKKCDRVMADKPRMVS